MYREINEICNKISFGDLEEIRKRNITYHRKYIKDATYYGHLDIVKYFIDEFKAVPSSVDIATAFTEGHFDIFFYFLDSVYDIDLSYVFDNLQYRFQKCNTNCQFVNQEVWNTRFKRPINTNTEISIIIRLLLSLCQYKSYKVSEYDSNKLIFAMKKQMSIPDFYFFIDNFSLEEISKDSIIRLYNLDINIKSFQKLSSQLGKPITNSLIRDIFEHDDTTEYKISLQNILIHIENYGIELTDSLPYTKHHEVFKSILEKIDLNHELWYKWIHDCITNKLGKHLEYLFDYHKSHITNLTERHKNLFFLNVLSNLDHEVCDCFLKQFPDIHCEWLDLIKLQGLENSEDIKENVMEKYPNLIGHINFDVKFPERKEEWTWWGIGSLHNSDGTYVSVKYKEVKEINPKFVNIKTMTDLKDNLDMLNEELSSPTDCYFDIYDEVFYNDSQGCLTWALEASTGRVYIYDPDNIFNRTYVAKSLSEFLTHINMENEQWNKQWNKLLETNYSKNENISSTSCNIS